MNNKVSAEELFYGPLASVCRNYVAEKKALGYDYSAGAQKILRFIKFCDAYEIPENTLPEKVVMAYAQRRPNEAYRNCEDRCSVLRGLAEYMIRNNYDAFLLPLEYMGQKPSRYTPYIFTHDEIRRFFAAADSMTFCPRSGSPRRHLIMPVLFRCLYCCGLRLSEGINLLGEDVDLDNGILLIRESKFDQTRYVPVSNELVAILNEYDEHRLRNPDPKRDWFFASTSGNPYAQETVYYAFRECLEKAGISHRGKGKGPRIHDFRHTFAVHCLYNTVEQGLDPTVAMPKLSTYMGHSTFASTEYYLRMTAEVFPQISKQLEEHLGYIIPDAKEVYQDEEG